MARTVVNFTISDEGRDKGKIFVLTEMSASQAEAWALRALLALSAAGVKTQDGDESMAAMADFGFASLKGLEWKIAEPLLAEMWTCVRYAPDPHKLSLVRNLVEEDIEEVATRIKLRLAVWNLHTDFLKAAAPSVLEKPAAAKKISRNM